jgi:MFS family permease
MGIFSGLHRGTLHYLNQVRKFNRNIQLLWISSVLGGVSQGIFSVVFNLYILSLGYREDDLGRILSAGPFAHALASIPIGFLGEIIGYKGAFLAIYGLTGLSQLVQVATPQMQVISLAAFVGGLAMSGNFVVRLPFLAANVEGSERTHVFSLNSLLHGVTIALGALLAGHLPNLLTWLTPDLTLRYRYTLYVAGACTLLATLPILFIEKQVPRRKEVRISLQPYLWGVDAFTLKVATVELFIGLTMGLVSPFMNLYFIEHLGTSREFYSTIAALLFLPSTVFTVVGPALAVRFGTLRTVVASRLLIPLTTLILAFTGAPLVGTGAYWGYQALLSMSQSLWFAFVMEAASPKAKVATSAWLEITYWLGQGIAALVTGSLLAEANYVLPFLLSSGAAVTMGVLTQLFVGGRDAVPEAQPIFQEGTEV